VMVKHVDHARTLKKYIERMKQMDDDVFRVFEDAMIGTFELYSTRTTVDEGDHLDCFATALLREVHRRDIACLGVTSERKHRGEYICNNFGEGRDRSNTAVVYCGKHSYFSGHKRSVFAPVKSDYVFLQ